MTIEIVDFPMKNGGSFNSYVKLPEGNDWMIMDDLGVPPFEQTSIYLPFTISFQ